MPSDELLLKITEQGSTEVVRDLDKVADGIDGVSKSEKKLVQSGKESTQGFNKQQASIISANQALDLFGRGLNIAKGLVEESVGAVLEYSKQVRDLSTNLGISAEETSKIIQASDDYGISVGEITSALQMAVKKGFAPNIETLAKLADEYNNIKDPIERAARLTDVFGRNWTALTPMLKEGGQAIRDAADEAERMGLVLSEKDVQSARALEIQIDNLNDRVEAIKLQMGKGLIPVLINVADAGGKAAEIISGQEDKLSRLNRERGYLITLLGKESEWVRRATAEIDAYSYELDNINAQEAERNRLLNEAGRVTPELTQGIRNQAEVYTTLDAAMNQTLVRQNLLISSQKELAKEQKLVSDAAHDLTKEFIFQKAAEGLTAEAALKLGLDMGVLRQETVNMIKRLDILKQKFDRNHDGIIDNTEATAGYDQQVQLLASHINSLQDKTVNLTTVFTEIHEQRIPTEPGRTYPLPGGAQHGADFIVPPNPRGGRGDYFPVIAAPGERVTVTPQGRGMGGVNIGDVNITIGGTNATPDAIKQAVYSGIAEVFQGAAR